MTARSWARVGSILVVTAILQVGLLDNLSIDGAHADAFLLIAIVAGLVAGSQQGAVIGFVTGLVADLFVLTPFGLSSLCYVLVAFGTGYLASMVPGGRAPNGFRILVATLGGIAGSLLYAAIAKLIDQPSIGAHHLLLVCAVVAVANAILAVPAVLAMTWALKPAATRDLATVSGGSAVR